MRRVERAYRAAAQAAGTPDRRQRRRAPADDKEGSLTCRATRKSSASGRCCTRSSRRGTARRSTRWPTSSSVTTRTIRRDLAALQEAGFPLYDERDDEGRVRWRLDGQVLKGLETGFTLPELCALYLSRNLLEAVGRHAVSARPDATPSRGSRRCCRRACGSSSIGCPACSPPSPARARAAASASADIVAGCSRRRCTSASRR